MENHIDHPLTVTVEEAAKLLGIGRSTAYELIHTGDIPSLRLGRRLVVPVAQIADQLGLSHDDIWLTMDARHQPPLTIGEATSPHNQESSLPGVTARSESPTLF